MHLIHASTINRPALLVTTCLSFLILTGCQSVRPKPAQTVTIPTTTTTQPSTHTQASSQPTSSPAPTTIPEQFAINGKIGITTPQQAGSAFYTWGQNGNNFAIDLAGALNAGQTIIKYNGQTATLSNDKGTLTADSPEELLFKATKWQAPISQLPYWIMGQSAPSDMDAAKDAQNRLTNAINGQWSAEFGYANDKERLPNRITMRHPDGYKVVMTINRLS